MMGNRTPRSPSDWQRGVPGAELDPEGALPGWVTEAEARRQFDLPPSHSEVVNARIAAFPRAVQAIRNTTHELPPIQEKDILRLAVELVK